MRGATKFRLKIALFFNISIHAPHARSDPFDFMFLVAQQISIHAPHARSDSMNPDVKALKKHFNPRSSCEERQHHIIPLVFVIIFQSTLLMRGATRSGLLSIIPPNFNPRSSCEERQIVGTRGHHFILFQSTLLMRGATQGCLN